MRRGAQEQLDAAAALAPHFDVALQASFHEVRAETHAAIGDARDGARRLPRPRHASRTEPASAKLIAQIENNYALVAADLGELDLAIERHEIALAEARRTSMLWRVAYSALNYADTLMLRGELERARAARLGSDRERRNDRNVQDQGRGRRNSARATVQRSAICSRPAPTTKPQFTPCVRARSSASPRSRRHLPSFAPRARRP